MKSKGVVFELNDFTEEGMDRHKEGQETPYRYLILPFFILPLIGVILYASVVSQPPVIELVNQSPSNSVYVDEIASYITSHGGQVINSSDSNVTPDVILTFLQGSIRT